MGPVGTPAQAALDDAAVHQPFRVAGPDGGQDFQVGFVQQLGAGFQSGYLFGGFNPAHPVHQLRAVHQAGVGQQPADFLQRLALT